MANASTISEQLVYRFYSTTCRISSAFWVSDRPEPGAILTSKFPDRKNLSSIRRSHTTFSPQIIHNFRHRHDCRLSISTDLWYVSWHFSNKWMNLHFILRPPLIASWIFMRSCEKYLKGWAFRERLQLELVSELVNCSWQVVPKRCLTSPSKRSTVDISITIRRYRLNFQKHFWNNS